jgi:hypothetical protein
MGLILGIIGLFDKKFDRTIAVVSVVINLMFWLAAVLLLIGLRGVNGP